MCDFSVDNLSYISLGTNPLVEPKQWQTEYLFRCSTRQNQGHSKLNERLKSHIRQIVEESIRIPSDKGEIEKKKRKENQNQ